MFPGYQPVANPDAREKFQKAWQATLLPPEPGLTVMEMLHAVERGQDQGPVHHGREPRPQRPERQPRRGGLEQLEFLVVQDIFLTETAELADVVLPAATFAEKDGTFTNTERRVQRVRKAHRAARAGARRLADRLRSGPAHGRSAWPTSPAPRSWTRWPV